jgi:polyisoprenoid-binding protein YceI
MLRRVVIGVSVSALVVVVVGALVIQRLVFGGTPTVHRPFPSATSVVATPCATLALSAGERGFTLDAQHSTAGYEAHFQAAGQPVPGTVDGVTGFVTGGFLVTPNPNPTIRSLLIRVDLRTLDSGSSDRDDHVRNDTFEVSKYPFATFMADQTLVLAGSYVEGQSVTFPLSGALTLHGVTRPVTFAMHATLQGDTLMGSGTAHVHITDFGMKQPQITSVVQVTIADDIALSISFTAHATTCALPHQY